MEWPIPNIQWVKYNITDLRLKVRILLDQRIYSGVENLKG